MLFGKRPKFLLDLEYWVYLPGAELPSEDAVMTAAIQGNSGVEPRDGIVFSDVRLTTALALRKKNPHVFRPDTIGEEVCVTEDLLTRLADSESFARVRYLSEEPVEEPRYLRLLPHLACAIGRLGQGLAVYDCQAERLERFEEFAARFEARRADEANLHVSVIWKLTANGGMVKSKGLRKIGLPDFRTHELPPDHRSLALDLALEAAETVFRERCYPNELWMERFGDQFEFLFETNKAAEPMARILRKNAVP